MFTISLLLTKLHLKFIVHNPLTAKNIRQYIPTKCQIEKKSNVSSLKL